MATKTYAKVKTGGSKASLSSLPRTTKAAPSPLMGVGANSSSKKSYKKRGTENDFQSFQNISFGNTGMTGED